MISEASLVLMYVFVAIIGTDGHTSLNNQS